jgi:hypothetical protein
MALELREHLDRPRGKPSIIYIFGPFLVGNFVSIVESLEKFSSLPTMITVVTWSPLIGILHFLFA